MTKARERKALGEGLALGAIMLGIESVMAPKMNLELDFRQAWHDWPHRPKFHHIKAGPYHDDVLHILDESPRKQGPLLAYWESSWPFVPVLGVTDWTAEEIAEIIHEGIPADAWKDLTRDWLKGSTPSVGGE